MGPAGWRVCFFCTMMEPGCSKAAWSNGTARRQSHHSPRHHACCNSLWWLRCSFPAAQEYIDRGPASLPLLQCAASRPAYCRRVGDTAGRLHQRRHVGSRPEPRRGLQRLHTSPSRRAVFTARTRFLCTTAEGNEPAVREAGKAGPKKLETQKRGSSGAYWLRMQMPRRGN